MNSFLFFNKQTILAQRANAKGEASKESLAWDLIKDDLGYGLKNIIIFIFVSLNSSIKNFFWLIEIV